MLLERSKALAELHHVLGDANRGQGRLVLLGGGAGSGKTALAQEFLAAHRAAAGQLRVLHGACDDLTTPAPLGPVLEALPEVEDVEAVGVQLYSRVRALLAATPTLLVLEDLHWADGATCDLLRFVGRRLDGLPLMVIATYRDDGLETAALTRLLGSLATGTGVHRMGVGPLSPEAVADLVRSAGSPLDPRLLHGRTGGNPFFVTEVLASGGRALPPTVRDAVLVRVEALRPDAREVMRAAAVIGQPAGLSLLAAVSGSTESAVDECVATGLLVGGPHGWDFRHALARLAVLDTLLPTKAATLHRAALTALVETGVLDDRRLAHHAAGCDDAAATARHAASAGTRAARLGAHAEAVPLLRSALEAISAPDPRRAQLCSALSYECYLTGRMEEARDARLESLELAVDAASRGEALRWLSRLSWFLGENDDAWAYAERAVEALEPLGPSPALAMAYSNLSQLAMLAGDVDPSVEWGTQALAMARDVGDRDTEIHALNNIGSALFHGGSAHEGLTQLRRSLDLALAADAHEHAARAFTNLGSVTTAWRRYDEAAQHLRAGIAYCAARDLDSWELYMSAWYARVLAEQGHDREACVAVDPVLAAPDVAPVIRIPALVVDGILAVRRGEAARGEAVLQEAAALAEGTHETQRLVPVATALAEASWLRGSTLTIPGLLDEAWRAAVSTGDPWDLGELAWWYSLAGHRPDPGQPIAPVYEAMVAGRWREAAAVWDEIGSPLWAAVCLSRVESLAAARDAVDRLDRLGLPPVRAAVLRDRVAAGLPVPRGPRASTTGHSAGLTARESEVLALLVEGLSDADIAAALVLSPKTVGHHVSKVLAKMGEPTRSRAAAAAVRQGLLAHNMGSPPDAGTG